MPAFQAAPKRRSRFVDGGGIGYAVRGLVNVPLIADRLAIRVAAGYRDDAGYVDNTRTGRRDVNGATAPFVRAMAKAVLSDWLTVNLMYVHDEYKQSDFNEIDRTLPGYQQSLPDDRTSRSKIDIYSGTITADAGFATISSNTSYVRYDRVYTPRFVLFPFPPSVSSRLDTSTPQKTFTQELRLTSQGSGAFSWVAGGFYRDRTANSCANIFFPDLATLFPAGTFSPRNTGCQNPTQGVTVLARTADETFKQYALYGEATMRIGDQLKIFGGLRYYNEQLGLQQQLVGSGPVTGFTTAKDRAEREDQWLFIGRAGLTFEASRQATLYALWSQGFRSGGPNLNSSDPTANIPAAYQSDGVNNYEAGFKTTWLEGRLLVNGSFAYIRWSGIQSTQTSTTASIGSSANYVDNAGNAEIKTVELAIVAPTGGLVQCGGQRRISGCQVREEQARGRHSIGRGPAASQCPGIHRVRVRRSASAGRRW